MNDELLKEIVEELRRQNVLLAKLERKQSESTWYLWLLAVILAVSIVLPFVMGIIKNI